jgi:two-component system, probable response regulator PhcQ
MSALSVKPRRILVVDDEVQVTTALVRSLRREPYTVVAVDDPFEALGRLRHEPFDIVITDHLMPGMTGLELSKIIRDRHPHVLRLMLTGQPDVEMLIKAINHGEVYRFITKPWDDIELKVTLTLAFEHLDAQRSKERVSQLVQRWHASF